MNNPWIAVNAATDRVAWARLLRRAHDIALSGRGSPPVLREVIGQSWARSARAGVDPDQPAPLVLDADQVAARFAEHPLAGVVAIVRHLVGAASDDARHLIALSDADGILLWAEGHRSMLEAAIEPRFVPGSLCSESALGTNAIGTALALDHAVQVFSAEHFNRLLHGWSCSAAPIHDPGSGKLLGALDVSGSFRTAHPHTLALVSAAARAAEAHLAGERQRRDAELTARYIDRLPAAGRRRSALVTGDGRVLFASPPGWLAGPMGLPADAGSVVLADGTRALVEPLGDGARIVWGVRARERRVPRRSIRIRAMGVEPPDVRLDGRRLTLSLRHVEILVLLALRPDGLSAGGLARALHGDGAKAVTVRAEVTRLRRVVGDIVLGQPYRLAADVRADFLDGERLLRRGEVERALALCRGPLLAPSHAPGIVAARTHLREALDAAPGRNGDGLAGRLRAVNRDAGTRVA